MQTSIRVLLAFLGAVAGLLVLVPVILLAIPLWLVGWLHSVARHALARSRPATISWEQMMAYEPEVGWKPLPGLDAWAEGTPPFHVRTDSEGWRGPGVSIEDAQVVVFGDSFCFGHGADEERFFANLTGGPVVKAIGANGYNMVQGLMWMKRYSKRLAGRTVVWLVYYGNDLLDNLRPNMGRYRIPFVRREQGGKRRVGDRLTARQRRAVAVLDQDRLHAVAGRDLLPDLPVRPCLRGMRLSGT